MNLPDFVAVFFLFLMWNFLLFGHGMAHTVTFDIRNKCPFPIWPATAPNNGQPVIADGGFYLPAGQTRRISAPWSWNGRIWARTGCNFASNWNPACETGDCGGRLACNGLIGTPPVTLVQVSLQGDKDRPNFYDVSLVDGYNLPVAVLSKPVASNCGIGGCLKNLKSWCPEELKVLNSKGEVVACKSACLAFNTDPFCCRNEYGTPAKCKPSVYSKIFKDACPSYYSYAYDSPPPLVTCKSSEYVITFCPSGWGTDAYTSI
ncbi:PREDICTED: thaumatin-like protein [Prunus mume]|uniref:Thaumatin-like protein n=1 Tax=Prunus mume TaxID=102107 RepID=A0ABM0NW49_PRUMU|nr:PREDICTED: thaumatin-like protein [Prunus mume]